MKKILSAIIAFIALFALIATAATYSGVPRAKLVTVTGSSGSTVNADSTLLLQGIVFTLTSAPTSGTETVTLKYTLPLDGVLTNTASLTNATWSFTLTGPGVYRLTNVDANSAAYWIGPSNIQYSTLGWSGVGCTGSVAIIGTQLP